MLSKSESVNRVTFHSLLKGSKIGGRNAAAPGVRRFAKKELLFRALYHIPRQLYKTENERRCLCRLEIIGFRLYRTGER